MRLLIDGTDLPGRDCGPHRNVHVGVQVGRDPEHVAPGDAESVRWQVDVRVIQRESGPDFRGPAVHGKPGERFVYLTWGEVTDAGFAMFRRAKLMLADVPDPDRDTVEVGVDLTDEVGMPRCGRLGAPAVTWR